MLSECPDWLQQMICTIDSYIVTWIEHIPSKTAIPVGKFHCNNEKELKWYLPFAFWYLSFSSSPPSTWQRRIWGCLTSTCSTLPTLLSCRKTLPCHGHCLWRKTWTPFGMSLNRCDWSLISIAIRLSPSLYIRTPPSYLSLYLCVYSRPFSFWFFFLFLLFVIYLSVYLSICLSLCIDLSIWLSVYLSLLHSLLVVKLILM